MPAPDGPASRAATLAGAALVAVVVAVHANALGATFQFDDWNVVVEDPRVQSLGAWWASMPGIRPLLKLTYALDHASGLGSVGFHASNLLVHLANALLVLVLLERLAHREDLALRARWNVALGAALVFALHPVQTEAVAYVSGRSTSLAACFSLASLLAWIEGRERDRPYLADLLSPLLLACALGVKETAVVVPAAILLWWATGQRGPLRLRDAMREVAPHALVLLVAAVAAATSPTYRHLLATSFDARGVGENLLTQVGAVTYLAGQLVRLDRINPDPALPVISSASPGLVLEALGLLVALALGLATLRSRPGLAFGIVWFFLWLAPTNSLVPRLDVANDRQLYLAIVGPAWLVARGLARSPRRALAAACLVVVCLVLGGATLARNRVYHDEIRFWEDVARKAPHNARAFNNLGFAYALACRTDEAESAFVIARDLAPRDVTIAVNLKLLRRGALLPPDHPPCAPPGAVTAPRRDDQMKLRMLSRITGQGRIGLRATQIGTPFSSAQSWRNAPARVTSANDSRTSSSRQPTTRVVASGRSSGAHSQ